MKNIFFLFFFLCTLVACKESVQKDTNIEANAQTKDSLSTGIVEEFADSTKTEIHAKTAEQKESLEKIEKEYGKQWSFCDCVVASDSVNKAIAATEDFESTEFDKLVERSDYVAKKCKAFLSFDANTTPEERALHKKKVRNCLNNAR